MLFPMTGKINPGFGVNLDSFHNAKQKFRDILKILEENKLNMILSARSKLFETELTELHNTVNLLEEGIIKGIVHGTEVTISASLIADVFDFEKDVEEDVLTDEDLGMTLTAMKFTGLKPSNLKKIEVGDEFRFLADIIGKVIFCKTSCHDVINRKQLRVMSYVVLKKKMDWGKLIFKLLQTKLVLPVIPYGRILSVILSTSYPSICLSKGIPIPPGRRLSSSLFSKWKGKFSKTKTITTNEPSFPPTQPTSFTTSSPSLSVVIERAFQTFSDTIKAELDSLSLHLTSMFDSLKCQIDDLSASVNLLSETLAHSPPITREFLVSLIDEVKRMENYANFPVRQSGSRGDTCSCGSYDYSPNEESEEHDFKKSVETALDTACIDKTASSEGIALSGTENLETTEIASETEIMDTENDEDAAESKEVTNLVFASRDVQTFSQMEIVPELIAEKTSEKIKEDSVYTKNEDILLKKTACSREEKTDVSSISFPESRRRSKRLECKASKKEIEATGNELIAAVKVNRMRDVLLNPQGKRFLNVDARKAKNPEALAVQTSDHKGKKGLGFCKDTYIQYKRSKLGGPTFAKLSEVLISHIGVPPVLLGSKQKINIPKKTADKLKPEQK